MNEIVLKLNGLPYYYHPSWVRTLQYKFNLESNIENQAEEKNSIYNNEVVVILTKSPVKLIAKILPVFCYRNT